MSDNPLDIIPVHNRVSIRAVLVRDGEDPSAALSEAGILDPIAVSVMFDGQPGQSGGILGDGITANLTAVLEHDRPEAFGAGATEVGSHDRAFDRRDGGAGIDPGEARTASASRGPETTATVTLPAAYGLQPLAPVRPRGQSVEP